MPVRSQTDINSKVKQTRLNSNAMQCICSGSCSCVGPCARHSECRYVGDSVPSPRSTNAYWGSRHLNKDLSYCRLLKQTRDGHSLETAEEKECLVLNLGAGSKRLCKDSSESTRWTRSAFRDRVQYGQDWRGRPIAVSRRLLTSIKSEVMTDGCWS